MKKNLTYTLHTLYSFSPLHPVTRAAVKSSYRTGIPCLHSRERPRSLTSKVYKIEELRQPQCSQKKPRLYTPRGKADAQQAEGRLPTRAAAASSCARQTYHHSNTTKSLFYTQLSASNEEAVCQLHLAPSQDKIQPRTDKRGTRLQHDRKPGVGDP